MGSVIAGNMEFWFINNRWNCRRSAVQREAAGAAPKTPEKGSS